MPVASLFSNDCDISDNAMPIVMHTLTVCCHDIQWRHYQLAITSMDEPCEKCAKEAEEQDLAEEKRAAIEAVKEECDKGH